MKMQYHENWLKCVFEDISRLTGQVKHMSDKKKIYCNQVPQLHKLMKHVNDNTGTYQSNNKSVSFIIYLSKNLSKSLINNFSLWSAKWSYNWIL